MHMQSKSQPARLLRLMPLLLAVACATPSQPTSPVVVSVPELTPLPAAVIEADPPPSGAYWTMLTNWRKNLRERLSSTPTK